MQVTAVAQAQPVQGARNNHLVPIGFPCPDPLNSPCLSSGDSIALPGENPGPPGQYKLSPGNWGGLAFPDGQKYTGNHFSSAVANGYQGTAPILLGTVSNVITTTGNDVNNFAPSGLAARYNAGSELPGQPVNLADPRIIEVPMVQSFPNGKKIVSITGFITALLIPDGKSAFYAQVVTTDEANAIPDPTGANTGTFFPVLIR